MINFAIDISRFSLMNFTCLTDNTGCIPSMQNENYTLLVQTCINLFSFKQQELLQRFLTPELT